MPGRGYVWVFLGQLAVRNLDPGEPDLVCGEEAERNPSDAAASLGLIR